ncbi:MAG: metallophosphoesterase [Clostridiales bacterium]|nr:metallophosphoesterase [Clostridiales bacterium]
MAKSRILVVSDSHGNKKTLRALVEKYEYFEYLIHLGDNTCDLDGIEFKGKIFSVRGNADKNSTSELEKLLHIKGYNIWLTHGHFYGVKFGLNRLFYKALEKKADIVLFGHTHIALNTEYENTLFFNPGSLTYPRGTDIGSYGIIELDENNIDANILRFK